MYSVPTPRHERDPASSSVAVIVANQSPSTMSVDPSRTPASCGPPERHDRGWTNAAPASSSNRASTPEPIAAMATSSRAPLRARSSP